MEISKNINFNDKNLFLDDVRLPNDAFQYTQQTIFLNHNWEVVINYNEFTNWITRYGLPRFISFDHDLADFDELNENQDAEKTGYDCAKWLIDYCLDNNLKCPNFYCHSMNPVGRDKINSILEQFKNY